jgi:phosphatidylglycerol---prolipoprotein diacylglyceryl transferase
MQFPVYLWIGSWSIHPHFFFESLGYAIAFRLLWRQVRADSISASQRSSVMVGGIVGAVLGAKLLVLLQHIDLLWQNRDQLLLMLMQGKTVVGALLGGLVGVEVTKKWIGLQQATGDAFVYPLLVGTMIGRVGCFLTGLSDRTHGIPTTLPWGIDFGDGIPRHPTQLYEIIFLGFLLIILRRREWASQQEAGQRGRSPLEAGDLFKIYLISYLGFRFLVDFLKPDFHPLWGLSAIQFACLAGLIYYRRHLLRLLGLTRQVRI